VSRVTVVGGGLAGLLAAYRLLGRGHQVVLFESAPTPGGMIASIELAGLRVDSGAEAYATRGGNVAPLMAELGLEVAGPTGDPFVWWPTGSYPLATGVLGIPASRDDPALAALTDGERAVAAHDAELGSEVGADATTVGELVAARLGQAVVDKLVAPLTQGVYASDPARLSLAVAPALLPALASEGTLMAAVAKVRGPGAPSVEQPVGGMFRLIDVLTERVRELGGEIRLAMPVTALAPGARGGFVVTCRDGSSIDSDRVVLAAPAAVSLRLLAQLGVEAEVPAVKKARHVMLAVTTPVLRDDPVGSGVLMGTTDPSVSAKALTHYSAKWPWAREGTDVEVLRVSYPEHVFPTRSQAVADASALTGVGIDDADVVGLASLGWESMPVRIAPATRDHLLQAAAGVGVELVGAWLDGNGISTVVAGVERVTR